MCPPALAAGAAALSSMTASTMFAVSLGVSALSSAVGLYGQHQAAEAQAEAVGNNLQATRDAAAENMVRQTTDLHAREQQTRTATAYRLDNQRMAADRAQATASASSESAGQSLDALLTDYDRQYGNYADSQMQQLGFDMDQIDRTREGLSAQAQSRVNTVPRPAIQGPNYAGAASSFLGDSFNAFDTYSVRDPATGLRTFS